MRHAEAATSEFSDHARILTTHGRQDAYQMGQRLIPYLGKSCSILCSNAARARETCSEILKSNTAHTVVYSERIYTANHPHELTKCIVDLLVPTPIVMLIGHNPVLSTLSSNLTGDHVAFSTSNAQILSIENTEWITAFESYGLWRSKKWISF